MKWPTYAVHRSRRLGNAREVGRRRFFLCVLLFGIALLLLLRMLSNARDLLKGKFCKLGTLRTYARYYIMYPCVCVRGCVCACVSMGVSEIQLLYFLLFKLLTCMECDSRAGPNLIKYPTRARVWGHPSGCQSVRISLKKNTWCTFDDKPVVLKLCCALLRCHLGRL